MPKYRSEGPTRELHFKQLVTAHSAWRNVNDLNPHGESWETVYNRRFGNGSNDDNDHPDSESNSSDDSAQERSELLDEWMCLSRSGPNVLLEGREPGTRDISNPWSASYSSYENIAEIRKFLENVIENNNQRIVGRNEDVVVLSEEQGRILQLLELQLQSLSCEDSTNEQPDVIRRIIVQGTDREEHCH